MIRWLAVLVVVLALAAGGYLLLRDDTPEPPCVDKSTGNTIGCADEDAITDDEFAEQNDVPTCEEVFAGEKPPTAEGTCVGGEP